MNRATIKRLEKTFLGLMLSVMVLQGSILVWGFGFMLFKLISSIFV